MTSNHSSPATNHSPLCVGFREDWLSAHPGTAGTDHAEAASAESVEQLVIPNVPGKDQPAESAGRRPASVLRWFGPRGRDTFSLRKEVIQPQVLLRLPCYDFTPITSHTLGLTLLAVGIGTSSTARFRDVTGGVYKARERIHGAVLMRHY